MGYVIDYNTDKKYISIKVKGQLNFKMVEQYSVEATKLAHKKICHKYLIDHTETKLDEGIYKLHTDGGALEKFGFQSNDRIGIVIVRAKDSSHFFDKKVFDVNWSNFKYFDTVDKAIKWIVNGE